MKLVSVNLPTPDAKKLANFYHDVLGASIDDSHGGPGRIEIRFGEKDYSTVFIVATQDEDYERSATTACQGFEFSVQDANEEYKRILNLGIVVEEPPKDLPWGYRYFHIKDSDGNGIDLVQKL